MTDESVGRYVHGPDAQTERDFESLTDKQRATVDALVEAGVDATNQEVAERSGVTPSYVGYVENNFPHLVQQRRGAQQIAADGSGEKFDIRLSEQEVWKAIRLLPEDLSNRIFQQVHSQK